ncbi:MAG: (Fe-S)-binding protein [Bacteroidota bacterium]
MEKLFNPFVLPFTIGFSFIGIWFVYKIVRWSLGLSKTDKGLVLKGILTMKTWEALVETVRESLLHKKVFGRNIRLGYMHMSLAFGWFLLIVIGNIESTYYSGEFFKPIYVSVFWRFFDPGPSFPQAVYQTGFAFWMDLFLFLVLSGLAFAIIKRFLSRVVGMKKTTVQRKVDRYALTALWLIFPIRLIAESMTCGANGTGSFLTGSLGHLFSLFLNPSSLILPAWWVYSFVLGTFFVLLPFTRYAHIPSEPVLIFFRKYGVRLSPASPGYQDLTLHACSSCGVCIDPCQLSEALPGRRMQSNYFVQSVRHEEVSDIQYDCLMCGRCENDCPVGIELIPLRQMQRPELGIGNKAKIYGRLGRNGHSKRILYFAGCMTHLSPSIIRSMKMIFNQAGASWEFYDSDGQACCGRPLKLAGQVDAAARIRAKLEVDFIASGATLLVTSCPICFRIFNEDYNLPGMRVLHHTQYIHDLIEWNRIPVSKSMIKAVYHEPCELGRGSEIHEEPLSVIRALYSVDLTPEAEGLCCGGSLGGPGINLATRRAVARGAMQELTMGNPDVMVTACPLCKKTFSAISAIPVIDIAEATASCFTSSTAQPEKKKQPKSRHRQPVSVN